MKANSVLKVPATNSLASIDLHSFCQDSTTEISNSTEVLLANARELVIIDADVDDYQQLLQGIKPDIFWVVLDRDRDGVQQITQILRHYRGIETLHILSHGSPGCLHLGNTQLSLGALSKYTEELQEWFMEVPSPNLFIYGCRVAAGNTGTEFLTKVRGLTKANIAASANLTGSAALGGDWELEISLGEGQFIPAFTSESLVSYGSVLDTGDSIVSGLPSFAQKWIDKNNPVPNVLITEAGDRITASYNGTLDITANINEILAKLGLTPITQQISTTNPTLVVQGTAQNPTGYEFSVSGIPVGEIMNGLGQLTSNADLFKGLSSTGNVDLVLSDRGVKVGYVQPVQLDINDIIDTTTVIDADNVADTSNTNAFVQKAIENVEKALSDAAIDATKITLQNSSLEVTQDGETEIKLQSTINGEQVIINYRTPTNLSFSLPDFDEVDLSNLLSDLSVNIPGIDLPNLANFDWPSLNLKGLNFELSFVDGIPDFNFTLPNLPIANLKSLFDGFGLSVPSLDFLFDLPNLPNLSLSIGTDLFKIEGLNLNFSDFLKGFGVDLPGLPDFNFEMPSLDIAFVNGIPSIELPSLPTDFINDLLPTIGVDFQFAKDLLNPIINEAKKFKVEPKKDEIKITYLDDINISSIVETIASEAGLTIDLEDLTVTNPGLRIKKQENGQRLYEVSIGEFSPTEAVNFLTGEAGLKLPDIIQNQLDKVGNVSLSASKQGFGLTYLDNITLDVNNLVDSDGFIKDAANTISETFLGDGDDTTPGTQLILAKPEVEFTNKGNNKELSLASSFNGQKFDLDFDVNFDPNISGVKIPNLSGFEFELPKLDATKLKNAFNSIAGTELPGFAEDLLTTLASLTNFNIDLSDDGLAVTYLGNLDVKNIINSVSSTLGLGDNVLSESLTVTNPGLRIAKDADGNKLYEVSVGEFSPTQAVDFLSNTLGVQLPSAIQDELDKVGNVALFASTEGFALKYLDDVTLDINSLIGDNLGSLKQPVNDITAALLGDGSDAEGTQLVLAKPEVEFTNKDNNKELSFAGSFNGTEFDFDFDVNVDPNVSGVKIPALNKFDFEMPSIDVQKLKDGLNSIAGELPGFITSFLDALGGTNSLDIEVTPDGFAVTYLDTLDVASIVNKIADGVGLGTPLNADTKFEVTNPGLRISKDENGERLFEVTIDEFSPAQVVEFFTDVVGINSLPDFIQNQLDSVGNASLSLSSQGFALKYLDDVTLDINSLIGDNLGSLKQPVNDITAALLGDGDQNTEGTQLVLAKPEVEFTSKDNQKQLSFAGSFNGAEFDISFDPNLEGQTIPQLSGFEFEMPSIDVQKLKDGLNNIAGELPGFITSFLDALGGTNSLDIEVTPDGFAVTYLDTLDVASIVNKIADGVGLGTPLNADTKFEVKNPGLRISKDENGERLFEVTIDEFSPAQVVEFFADVVGINSLPDFIQSQLDSVGNASLSLSSQGFALKYLDDVTLDINSLIGDNLGSLKQPVNDITAALLGDGDQNTEGTQLVLAKPEVEFTSKDNQKQLSFAGSFNGAEFDISFDPNLEGQTIPQLSGFEFEMPSIDVQKLKDGFNSIAGELPGFITSFLDTLPATANLDIEVSPDGFAVTYLDTLNITSIVNSLTKALNLGEALDSNTALNVTNPGLRVNTNGSFEVTVGEMAPGEVITFLTKLAGTSLPNDIQTTLKSIGDVSLTLSNQGISLTYLEDLTLDLNKIVGDNIGSIPLIQDAVNAISETVLGDGDDTTPGTQLVLTKPELELTTTSLGLGGALNEREFELQLGDGIGFNYDIGELDVASIIPGLSGFNLDESELSFSEGFNLTGGLNFAENPSGISKFISETLGVDSFDIALDIGSGGASLTGNVDTDVSLFPPFGVTLPSPFKDFFGDFGVTLKNANLALDVGDNISGTVGGSIALKGYDPSQDSEPQLNLSAALELDPKGLTGKFEMATDDGTAWTNIFGIPQTRLENITVQVGGTYSNPTFVDNIGFVGDLKFGEYDFKSAFLVDTNDPQNFALELTLNDELSLIDIIAGPVYSYALNVALAEAENIPILDQAKTFFDSLKDLIPVTVVSIDGPDEDTELDPLIKAVPVETTIFNTTLESGVGINAGVKVGDKEGTLNLNANIFSTSPSIEGSLKIPEINVADIIKISGIEDPVAGGTDTDLNLDLKLNTSEQSFSGDGRIEILGREVAKADFKITPTEIDIKDLDFDLAVMKLDVNDLGIFFKPREIDGVEVIAQGEGSFELLGQEVAATDFQITTSGIDLDYFNLDVGVIELNVDDLLVDFNTQAASGKANVNVFNQEVAAVDFDISSEKFELKEFDLDLGFVDLDVDNLVFNTTTGNASGSGALEILGNKVADAEIKTLGEQLTVDGNLDLFGLIEINNAKIDVKGLDNLEVTGTLKLFGQELDNANVTFQEDQLTVTGGIDLDLPSFIGDVYANLTITSDGTLAGSKVNVDTSVGDFEVSLNSVNSIDDLIVSVVEEAGGGEVIEAFNDLADIGTQTITSATNFISNNLDSGFQLVTGTFNSVVSSISSGFKSVISWFGGRDENSSEVLNGGGGDDRIYGWGGDDKIYADRGNDKIWGGNENDEIHGYHGRDTLYGDSGRDVIYGQQSGDSISGGSGNDFIFGEDDGRQGQYYDGSDDNDTLDGNSGNDYIAGGLGRDTLWGSGDNDTLDGGNNGDYIHGGYGHDVLIGGGGYDYGRDTIYGYYGRDTINGGWGHDLIYGGSDNDHIFADDENDTVYGGSGNDYIDGHSGSDRLSGGSGDDQIYGDSGDDRIDGDSGDDYLDGGWGNDEINGDSGNDYLKGGSGNDSLIGGFDNGQDRLEGGSGNDALRGYGGSDLLDGGDGNDTLRGGSGDDVLKPGKGSDTIDGGNGKDILILSGSKDNYTITETSNGQEITDKRDNKTKIVTGVEIISYEQKLEGNASNGPLANATAFIDTNNNFQLDDGETQTTTDNNGEYSLPLDIKQLDKNGDGEITPDEAQLVVTGGTDTSTGLPGTIPLISQINSTGDYTTTTPLTTLKAVLSAQGIAEEQVETLLNKITGFSLESLSQPLDNFNAYSAIGEGDDTGINIASGHIKIMNLLLNGTTFLEAAGYENSDGQIQVITALGEVLETVESFDFSKNNDLQKFYNQLTEQLNLEINNETIIEVSKLVAQSNNLIDELVQEALSSSVDNVLPSINPIKQGVYSTLPNLTEQLVKGEITPEESQTQLQEILKGDTFLVEFALNEDRIVKVSVVDGTIEGENSDPEKENNSSITVTEGEDSKSQFIITLGEAAPPQGLKILYTISGTATLGQDYGNSEGLFGEINVEPGATEAVIDLEVLDDNISETTESITINLKYVGEGYALDPIAKTAVIEINDNDQGESSEATTEAEQIGTSEDDNITGSEENDRIEGNFGADELEGNAGDDFIAGGSENDTIKGGADNDQLQGDAGDDELEGNSGNDVIYGGTGNDVLEGNEDNDWLLGEAGEDIIRGGQGVDLLNGGEGADVFYFQAPNEGGDLIVDFDPAQGDKIQVSASGFNTDSLEDFNILAGTLYYKDEELALLQNNGQTYNHFGNLADIIEIVTEPEQQTASAATEVSIDMELGVAQANSVENPETTILDEIIKRGNLKVATAADGNEFDLEFARTIAAALFGDASKVNTVSNELSTSLERVADGRSDLASGITQTLGRDADLKIDFSPVYYYDQQEGTTEPIALALPENDSQWADIVRWVNSVPIQAEEFGISSENIDQLIAANTDDNDNNDSAPEIRRFLGIEGELGASLGLPESFAVNVIKEVGNYSEIYERHYSDQERNQNLLWSDGGLLYSPPFSGSDIDISLNNNDNRNLLKRIKDRGVLKLGLPGNNPGFAVETENGEFAGFDVDLGKAIAAALFEDPSQLEVTVQSFQDSFSNTANGVVDVSAMGMTHNLLRDATLGIDFSPSYLYTGQGVLVRSDSGINVLPALNGHSVGVLAGATALQNLEDTFSELGGDIIPVEFDTNDQMFAAYEAGEIDAVSTDMTILSGRLETLSNPDQHRILNDLLSKEPLGLIVDENQSEWSDVVRWVTNALVQAEEYGISSENIDDLIAQNIDDNRDNDSDSDIREFLGIEGNIGKVLGLPNDFVVNTIKAVGNYGEIYERNFDSDVLRREENELASNFGLQYAPPLGEEVSPAEQEELSNEDDVYEIQPSTLEDHPDGFHAQDGNDRVTGSIRSDLVHGGQGEDTISGNDGDDMIVGGPGVDYLYGKDGNDTLEGRPENDFLFGGRGDDELKGGIGRDRLNGGEGNDILIGGASIDQFIFATNDEFDADDIGIDEITDFVSGQDQILLDQNTFTAINDIETEFATVTSNNAASTSDAVIVYNSNNGALFYNTNGSDGGFGDGAQFATLSNETALEVADFMIR
ncbi:MAG: DUF4347 domain-containing protein [Cyanobacteriota bacterium]|nr:DUF4347 domain-containing protein [Cyanobacteriota bacterium]